MKKQRDLKEQLRIEAIRLCRIAPASEILAKLLKNIPITIDVKENLYEQSKSN